MRAGTSSGYAAMVTRMVRMMKLAVMVIELFIMALARLTRRCSEATVEAFKILFLILRVPLWSFL